MRKKKKKDNQQQDQALLMAELVIEVRAGNMTAREAASRLGVSTKTYYKWEKRGLSGLVTALKGRTGGRPPPDTDPEKAALREERNRYRKQAKIWRQKFRIKDVLTSNGETKKKEGGRVRGGKKRGKTSKGDKLYLPGDLLPNGTILLDPDEVAKSLEAEEGGDRYPWSEEDDGCDLG